MTPHEAADVGVRDRFARAIDRFAMLRHLFENHDGEGAAAPDQGSIEIAIGMLNALASGAIRPTLNDDGMAVIEIEDRAKGLYAEITFTNGLDAEVYVRMPRPPLTPRGEGD